MGPEKEGLERQLVKNFVAFDRSRVFVYCENNVFVFREACPWSVLISHKTCPWLVLVSERI
jgi:hypothetical protein